MLKKIGILVLMFFAIFSLQSVANTSFEKSDIVCEVTQTEADALSVLQNQNEESISLIKQNMSNAIIMRENKSIAINDAHLSVSKKLMYKEKPIVYRTETKRKYLFYRIRYDC